MMGSFGKLISLKQQISCKNTFNIVSIKLCAIAFIFILERIVIAKLQKLRQNMDDANILKKKMLKIIKADGDEESENIANDRDEDKYRDKNLFVMSDMLTGPMTRGQLGLCIVYLELNAVRRYCCPPCLQYIIVPRTMFFRPYDQYSVLLTDVVSSFRLIIFVQSSVVQLSFLPSSSCLIFC
jgi:hypothetical protein